MLEEDEADEEPDDEPVEETEVNGGWRDLRGLGGAAGSNPFKLLLGERSDEIGEIS